MNHLIIITRRTGINSIEERYRIEEIEAFYAEDKYTLVRTRDGKDAFVHGLATKQGSTTASWISRGSPSIKTIMAWLEAHGASQFLRTHRAWLVNMRHVKTHVSASSITGSSHLITYSGLAVPSARRKRAITTRAWRNGMGIVGGMVAIAMLWANHPTLSQAATTPHAKPKLPCIVKQDCNPRGCWIYFTDGTRRFIAK